MYYAAFDLEESIMLRAIVCACLLGTLFVVAPSGCSKEPDLNPPDAPAIPPGRTKDNPGVPPMPGGKPAVPAN
jgi:hypothetical protein